MFVLFLSFINYGFCITMLTPSFNVLKPLVRDAPAMVKQSREQSLGARGPQIFKLLPGNLRSMNADHVDTFKNHLDIFLSCITDQPTMTGMGRAAESNSLLHQLQFFKT